MGILNNIGSLFVEQVEIDGPEKSTSTVTNLNVTAQQKPYVPFTPGIAASSIASQEEVDSLDKSSRDKLEQAIIAKSPKFFSKLNDLLNTLAEDMPSEAARYKTAIKLLVKDGASPPAIISDLDLCISAIDDTNKDFNEKVNKKIDDQVNLHKSNIANIDQQLQLKTQQIQSLQAEIISFTQARDQENNSITTESAKLNLRKDRFNIVYTQLHGQLDSQKQKLNEYIK